MKQGAEKISRFIGEALKRGVSDLNSHNKSSHLDFKNGKINPEY